MNWKTFARCVHVHATSLCKLNIFYKNNIYHNIIRLVTIILVYK